ncbi:hypothetical protein BEWA_049840 [Theileria equi strain WA]|uniref:SAP domain-containing protein n=1 Tax=Theileria equi strain WA TaxID=1537102 RepID=L1LAL8_THEEQ|nr:hypothetical protein BEWA_049840 [Theileria equi strain WA]EKX72517.1 hypothetical protein BEWA_049840 [Theileria equi strain WA]|eukprot:XP_004831969.1 hypothetical protein BEWA_049840 [Theileria equi strain WA]
MAEGVENRTLAELKALLAKHKLPTTGKRAELVERYLEFVKESGEAAEGPSDAPEEPLKAEATTLEEGEVPSDVTNLTFEERMKIRAARFNMEPSEKEKAEMRKQRFGLETKSENKKRRREERLKKKMTLVVDDEELERRKKRLERFGAAQA